MDSLFDLFDIPKPEKDTEQKEKRKKGVSKKSTKEKKSYKVPLVVNFGGIERTLTGDEAGAEKIGQAEVYAFAEKNFRGCYSDIVESVTEDGVMFITYRNTGVAKGKIAIDENTRFLFGDYEIEFPHDEDSVDANSLQTAFQQMFGDYYPPDAPEWNQIGILHSIKGNLLVPVLPIKKRESIEMAEKITILLPNREMVSYTADDVGAVLKGLNLNEENPDDTGTTMVPADAIAELLKKADWNFGKGIAVCDTGLEDTYAVWRCRKSLAKSSGIKLEVFPVEGVKLSVLYESYTLTTSDFGGKESVTKEELINYLVNKGHPEYAIAEGVRAKYDKDRNMIVVVASGSSKGAASNGAPIYIDTPSFTYYEPMGLCWKIRRIPEGVLRAGENICRIVNDRYQTEVCLSLYYSWQSGIFFWMIPSQRATSVSVMLVNDSYLDTTALSGLLKIGQFHSHGALPAFFSSIDDADEKFPGIYGVWGNLNDSESSFQMRAAVGQDIFLPLKKEDIFKSDADYSIWPGMTELLCSSIRKTDLKEAEYDTAEINGLEVLVIRKGYQYLARAYKECISLYVYYLRVEEKEYYLGLDADKAIACIVSNCNLDNLCGLIDKRIFRMTGRKKSLMEYGF